jgi:hypothetical protein
MESQQTALPCTAWEAVNVPCAIVIQRVHFRRDSRRYKVAGKAKGCMGWNLGHPGHAVRPLTGSVLDGLQFSCAICWRMPAAEREERLRIAPAMCDHNAATRLERENDRKVVLPPKSHEVQSSAVKVGLGSLVDWVLIPGSLPR